MNDSQQEMNQNKRRTGKAYYNAAQYGILECIELSEAVELPDEFIVLDLETTGLDYIKDRIIEVAIIKYSNKIPVDMYSQLFDPERRIPAKVANMSGIKDWMVRGRIKIYDAIDEIYNLINDQVIVGYNIEFDISFLNIAFGRSNLTVDKIKTFDVLKLARKCISSKEITNYKLPTVKKHFGIKKNSHRALFDCQTTYEVLGRCLEIQSAATMETI